MQAFNNDPYADVRFVDMRTEIDFSYHGDKSIGTTIAQESQLSDSNQIINNVRNMSIKIGTMELNQCILDDSYVFPADNSGEIGFRSFAASDSNRLLSNAISIDIDLLPTASDLSGLMIDFDDKTNEYPEAFEVTFYGPIPSGGSQTPILYTESITENISSRYALIKDIDGVASLNIIISRMYAPYRKVKIAEVTLGYIEELNKGTVISMKALYEFSPTTDTLPSCELDIVKYNDNDNFNPFNSNSLYAKLKSGMLLPVDIGMGTNENIEYVRRGQFVYNNATLTDDMKVVNITANNGLYWLDIGQFERGYLGSTTLSGAISYILNPGGGIISGRQGLEYTIDSNVASRVVYMAIPKMSVREALQLVIQAAMCWAVMDVDGSIRIKDGINATPTVTYDADKLHSTPTLTIDKSSNSDIQFATYQYLASSENTELGTYEVTIGRFTFGQTVVLEHEPASNLSWTVTNGAKISIDTSSAFRTILVFQPSSNTTCTVKLMGNLYTKVPDPEDINDSSGDVKYNPAIVPDGQGTNAGIVQDWYNNIVDESVQFQFSEMGNPAQEISDSAVIEISDTVSKNVLIRKEEYNFDGGLSCDIEAVSIDGLD